MRLRLRPNRESDLRVDAEIQVLSGVFDNQHQVFEHLLQGPCGADIDLDFVSVICRTDPRPRLGHHFEADAIGEIEEQLGLHTTVVLVLPGALDGTPLPQTGDLSDLGVWEGFVHVPDQGAAD